MVLAAVGQICSTASMAHNLAQCKTVIQKAVAGGAKALFLPEASDYISHSAAESLSLAQPASTSPFLTGLRDAARHHGLPISVGVHEPSSTPDRVANTLLWIDARGDITQRYQKLHLFDLELAGQPPMKESASVEPGREMLAPFESPVGKIGSAICFDLRFAEMALRLKRQGADVLVYPSAFQPATGRVHWMPLLQARAIETQCYVVAAGQVGAHNEKRYSYGHSLVISPWGEVLAEGSGQKGEEPEVLFAEIEEKELKRARDSIPLLRRTDVYPEV